VTLHSAEMLGGQSRVTRADVSLFVTCLFMAREMAVGVSGRPAAGNRLLARLPNLEDGSRQAESISHSYESLTTALASSIERKAVSVLN
jgi:hypothetical protein